MLEEIHAPIIALKLDLVTRNILQFTSQGTI